DPRESRENWSSRSCRRQKLRYLRLRQLPRRARRTSCPPPLCYAYRRQHVPPQTVTSHPGTFLTPSRKYLCRQFERLTGRSSISLNVLDVTAGLLAGEMQLSYERDDVLLRLAAKGEEAAFTELYSRHQAALYRYALRMTGSPWSAEEIVQ